MTYSFKKYREKLLDKIIGQEELINSICVLLTRHMFKIECFDDPLIKDKINTLLIIGETGSGKTYTVREAAKLLDLPLLELNGKSISQEGYKGTSLKEYIEQFMKTLDNTYYRQFPIIFIDEFDKLCTPESTDKSTNYSMHLQHNVLKYIDGIDIDASYKANTANFCWIFAGAFTEIHKEKGRSIGFNGEQYKSTLIEDIIKFGVIPELAGRIGSFVLTNPISRDILKSVICNPNSQFNQWYTFLRSQGIYRSEEPNYLEILDKATKIKLGVRGLNQLFEEEINKLIFKHCEKE